MSLASYEVQRAVYEALASDHQLTALVTGVFDYVPENQVFPYVKIGGGDNATPLPSTFTTAAREDTITVHIYSRYKGQGEIKRIAGVIGERLAPPNKHHAYQLNMTPWEWYSTLFDFAEFLDDPDGVTRHGVIRFRVRSQKTSA